MDVNSYTTLTFTYGVHVTIRCDNVLFYRCRWHKCSHAYMYVLIITRNAHKKLQADSNKKKSTLLRLVLMIFSIGHFVQFVTGFVFFGDLWLVCEMPLGTESTKQTRTLLRLLLQFIKSNENQQARYHCTALGGKLFIILYVTYLSLSVNIPIFRPAQTEMVVGPQETLQMGQLVPWCGPSHPDGEMSQKCQGKPTWLYSRYSSVIHHWTTPRKRPNSPTLMCFDRLYVGTVAISQTLVQYFICLFFKDLRLLQEELYIYCRVV